MLKTHSGAKKRFKMTKSGKIKRKRSKLRHLMTTAKSASKKDHLRQGTYIGPADYKRMRRLLPYG